MSFMKRYDDGLGSIVFFNQNFRVVNMGLLQRCIQSNLITTQELVLKLLKKSQAFSLTVLSGLVFAVKTILHEMPEKISVTGLGNNSNKYLTQTDINTEAVTGWLAARFHVNRKLYWECAIYQYIRCLQYAPNNPNIFSPLEDRNVFTCQIVSERITLCRVFVNTLNCKEVEHNTHKAFFTYLYCLLKYLGYWSESDYTPRHTESTILQRFL